MPSPTKLVLGMMSGTSADGIDTALVRISGAPPNLKINLLNHTHQIIFHQGPSPSPGAAPLPFKRAGFSSLPSTLQLVDGSIIANLTGITTISDFRPADMALGGQGALLVPFADYALYRHPKLG